MSAQMYTKANLRGRRGWERLKAIENNWKGKMSQSCRKAAHLKT